MLARQMAAPNSPQWFNTGPALGVRPHRPGAGPLSMSSRAARVLKGDRRLRAAAAHACFIQSVDDDLVNEGGIMDLWTREARLFKYGSGTGSNFSKLRGENEPLSGGGKSSGLMSLPRDRRPRGRRDQVGRHDPAGRQDGLPRPRPPGRRGLHPTGRSIEEQKVAALVTGSQICASGGSRQ